MDTQTRIHVFYCTELRSWQMPWNRSMLRSQTKTKKYQTDAGHMVSHNNRERARKIENGRARHDDRENKLHLG